MLIPAARSTDHRVRMAMTGPPRWSARWLLWVALAGVAVDTGFALWALRDPYDGGNIGGGAALFPLLLGGLPWSISYLFWPELDDESPVQTLYPLALGAMALVNVVIVGCFLHWRCLLYTSDAADE